jgi:hypothetical protein
MNKICLIIKLGYQIHFPKICKLGFSALAGTRRGNVGAKLPCMTRFLAIWHKQREMLILIMIVLKDAPLNAITPEKP